MRFLLKNTTLRLSSAKKIDISDIIKVVGGSGPNKDDGDTRGEGEQEQQQQQSSNKTNWTTVSQ